MKQSTVKKLRELFLNEWQPLRNAIKYRKQIEQKINANKITFKEYAHYEYGKAGTLTVDFEEDGKRVSHDWRIKEDGAYLIPIDSPFMNQMYDLDFPNTYDNPIEVCCNFATLSSTTGGYSFWIKKEVTSDPYKYFDKDFADKLVSIMAKG